jgi:hypothetical protein
VFGNCGRALVTAFLVSRCLTNLVIYGATDPDDAVSTGLVACSAARSGDRQLCSCQRCHHVSDAHASVC